MQSSKTDRGTAMMDVWFELVVGFEEASFHNEWAATQTAVLEVLTLQ
jgi:hypothetical protein